MLLDVSKTLASKPTSQFAPKEIAGTRRKTKEMEKQLELES